VNLRLSFSSRNFYRITDTKEDQHEKTFGVTD